MFLDRPIFNIHTAAEIPQPLSRQHKSGLLLVLFIRLVGIWPFSRPENLKKSRPKKLVKSISRIFFDQIPFFAISKMAKNQFLELGKSLKLPEMQFHDFFYLI